jgi:hypothetical protein
MSDTTEFDWSGATATTVKSLRAPKVKAVPESIVALAQKAYDAKDSEAPVFRYTFTKPDGTPDVERAALFAKHMKNAGVHTDPICSLSVAIDPDRDQSANVVAFKATGRRGRAATS